VDARGEIQVVGARRPGDEECDREVLPHALIVGRSGKEVGDPTHSVDEQIAREA
jgi:hypothetical protein